MTPRRKRTAAGAIVLAIIILATILLCGWSVKTELENVYTLRVELSGDRECTLEYGSEFTEPGASALFWGTNRHKEQVSVPVAVEGSVDTQKTGSYLLKYTAQYGGYTGTAYRLVRVVDTESPVITLVSDPSKYTLPNETYVEEGFSAADSCDGDLTALVRRTETREAVTYTVTDSSGNTTTVQRPILYNDPVAPVLELVGGSKVTVWQGQAYTELGYRATDNCDGDLTGQVSVTGYVDASTLGNYVLTYTVKDSYNNLASVSRTVSVQAPSKPLVNPNVVNPEGKVIYLTFDDGPGPRTPELLDILKKYNVKATFFVVNTKFIGTVARIAQEGHTVGIHSTTHKFNQIYVNEDAYFHDLYTLQDIIRSYTGQESTILRFPGGSSNTVSTNYNKGIMSRLAQMVHEKGFRYFDWNVDSNDAGGAKTATQVYNNVVRGIGTKRYSVVLQHDIKGYSIDAVEAIIIWGLQNGYTFLPLTQDSPICQHNIRN